MSIPLLKTILKPIIIPPIPIEQVTVRKFKTLANISLYALLPLLIRFGNGKKGKIKGEIYISIKHTWAVRFHKNMTRNGQITTEKRL